MLALNLKNSIHQLPLDKALGLYLEKLTAYPMSLLFSVNLALLTFNGTNPSQFQLPASTFAGCLENLQRGSQGPAVGVFIWCLVVYLRFQRHIEGFFRRRWQAEGGEFLFRILVFTVIAWLLIFLFSIVKW